MKKAISIILMLTLGLGAGAQMPEWLHIGADWGATATVLKQHHYNYMDEAIGFRIDDQGWSAGLDRNAYAYLTVDFEILNKFSLGLMSGYAGVADGVRAIPTEMRANFYASGAHQDGLLLFLQGGAAFKVEEEKGVVFLAQAGAGWRVALNHSHSLDFKIGIQAAADRPRVWDPLEETYISERNIRRNDALYFGVNAGFALVF